MAERVGFVGLGIMGRPMARNLLEAGYELVVFNRSRTKAEELAAGGRAEVAESPEELARGSDVVITMLPGPPEVEAVVAGDKVVSGGLAANKVMEVKGDKLLGHDFSPGGKVEFHHKDLGIALAAGREYGVTLPVTAVVDQMFAALEAKGRGGWNHSALLTLIEESTGHPTGAGG